MKSLRQICLAFVTLSILSLVQPAKALDFTFRIDNGIGNVSGSVYGVIYDLHEEEFLGDYSTPSDIVITSAPSELVTLMGLTPNYSLTGNGWDMSGAAFAFDVVGGEIVDSTAQASADGGNQQLNLFIDTSFSFGTTDQSVISDSTDLAAGHFAAAVVPEPSTYAFGLVSALALLIAWRRKATRA